MGPTREMMGEASDLCSESTDSWICPVTVVYQICCVYTYTDLTRGPSDYEQ